MKGSTAISAGIDDGIKVLTGKKIRPFAVKTMILMTDGIHNLGPEPILSARNAAKKDIVIHTITFSDDADIKRMKDVAAATGGKHFHAHDRGRAGEDLQGNRLDAAGAADRITPRSNQNASMVSNMRLTESYDRRHRARGATAVEFALTAPVFFLFLLACVRVRLAERDPSHGRQRGLRSGPHGDGAGRHGGRSDGQGQPTCSTSSARAGPWSRSRRPIMTPDTDQVTVAIDIPMNQQRPDRAAVHVEDDAAQSNRRCGPSGPSDSGGKRRAQRAGSRIAALTCRPLAVERSGSR